MSKYRIAVSESDLLNYSRPAEAKQLLLEKLREAERKVEGGLIGLEDIPRELGLERLDFEPLGEEEIKTAAEDKLSGEFRQKLEDLRKEYEDRRQGYEAERERTKEAGAAAAAALDENYGSAKQNLEDNALKRGLARSSVVMGQLEGLEGARAAGRSEIDAQVAQAVSELEGRIGALSGELESAEAREDADHAKRLREEIAALKAEQERRRDEVAKYNNTVAEKESKFALERELKVADRIAEALASGTGEKAEQRKSYERAKVIRDFLDTMPKDAALAFLTSDEEIKKAAGEYYSYLYNYFQLK